MKMLTKTFKLFLIGILIMPSFLLLFIGNNEKLKIDAHNDETTSYYCDSTYFDGSPETSQAVYKSYDTYSKQDWIIQYGMTEYNPINHLNGCAPCAGTIVIGYYDMFHTELIPNYEPGVWYEGQWYFYPMTETIGAVFEDVYTRMGTNTEAPGTSVNQFKTGLRSYVNSKGYNLTYNSCGTINTETVKNYIQQEKPIVVFMNSYRYFVDGIHNNDGNTLTLVERVGTNGHVVVAYGYREMYFTLDGESWTEKYLIISFGDGSIGMLDINNMSQIDNAFAVNIY